MKLAERTAVISPSPTLAIDTKAKKMQKDGIKVINFGVGEPDFDTPEHIKAAAIEAIQAGFTKYTPAAGIDELREAIANKLKVDNGLDYQPSQIVVSSGAKHSLYNVTQVLINPGDEVILPAPYWVSYIDQIKLAGGIPVIIDTKEENGFLVTPEELRAAITPKTRLFILNSPSNPTGGVYSKDQLTALGEILVQHQIGIISDEIYEKLLYDNLTHHSIAALSAELKELTVVINGVSKAFAMTGWRIGYAAAPAPVAKAMADLQSQATSSVNSIAQKASLAALTGTQEPMKEMVAEFAKRRDYIVERFKAIPGVSCNKPGGAFYVFPNVSRFYGKQYQGRLVNNSTDLADLLLAEAQVAVVPGVAFGADAFIRLSYATSIANIKEGLDRIQHILAQLS
ncbi:MAG: pyridoxal phosphate-dependent aminotransferase [Firmicutes bacterium]|nr:pyridoxal phosphate-dependent aminotransferase [Bacillota bacterium]